jgi:hypothetical protein
MATTFICSFANPITGEHRDVTVSPDEFDQHDLAAIAYHRACDGKDQVEFIQQAIVLRHAYQKLPDGFLHDRPPGRRLLQ